ncbi:MAG: ABC transporter permease, partial [Euryarchaeota archaeon]|nr:ABC transporter permease [Euryarchaeota archaeon]
MTTTALASGAADPTLGMPTEGRALPAFAIIGWRWISRNPAVAIAPVLIPFIFLYFLYLISPRSYFPAEIVGAMLFTTQNIGNWVLGDSAWYRIENALQDLFVASPLGKFRYLFGIAFSNLIAAIPALVVLGVLLALQPGVAMVWWAWAILAGDLLLLWIVFSAIGITISSRIRTRREVWPVGNLAFTTVGMISPLYFPLGILPPLWQDAAMFLPGTYAAQLAKGTLGLLQVAPTTGEYVSDAVLLAVV